MARLEFTQSILCAECRLDLVAFESQHAVISLPSGGCHFDEAQAAVYLLRGIERIDRVRMKPSSSDAEHCQNQDETRNEWYTQADR